MPILSTQELKAISGSCWIVNYKKIQGKQTPFVQEILGKPKYIYDLEQQAYQLEQAIVVAKEDQLQTKVNDGQNQNWFPEKVFLANQLKVSEIFLPGSILWEVDFEHFLEGGYLCEQITVKNVDFIPDTSGWLDYKVVHTYARSAYHSHTCDPEFVSYRQSNENPCITDDRKNKPLLDKAKDNVENNRIVTSSEHCTGDYLFQNKQVFDQEKTRLFLQTSKTWWDQSYGIFINQQAAQQRCVELCEQVDKRLKDFTHSLKT